MKLYTKTGDHGESSLIGKEGVPKCDAVFDLLGDLDESSAAICAAAAFIENSTVEADLEEIVTLFVTLGCIAAGGEEPLQKELIAHLESRIDAYQDKCGPFTGFTVTYCDKGAALLNLARTVVRRAERTAVRCGHRGNTLQIALNRTSDLLYAIGLYINGNNK